MVPKAIVRPKAIARAAHKAAVAVRKRRKSGRSGWAKYNERRKETGQRLDPYVSQKRSPPQVAVVVRDAEPAVAELAVVVAEPAVVVKPAVAGPAVAEPQAMVVADAAALGRGGWMAAVAGSDWPASVVSCSTHDVGVGEHLSGEPFYWKGIFDMP